MRMPVRVYISSLLTITFILIFQYEVTAQETSWLKLIGDEEENTITSTVLNEVGEIIITGSFIHGNGQMPIGTVILKSEAPTDSRCGFIAKLDGTGQVIWARVLQSNRFGSVEDAVLDTDGNIYVTGRFHGELIFENQKFIESSYSPQYFIAKYDDKGNPLWLKYIPGEVNIEVALCIDKQNNLYIACRQGKPLTNRVETTRIALYKYNSNGAPLMESVISTIPSSSSSAYIRDIIVDSKQQPVIVGTFMNSIKIGDQVFEGRSMSDAYILKCNADGSIKWATQIGKGELFSSVVDITFDSAENIYVTGSFSNKSDKVTLILKFNPEGDQTWQFSVDRKADFSYLGGITGSTVKVSNIDQAIILAGGFRGDIAFGSTILNSQRGENEYDVFITKIKNDGEIAGAVQSTGNGTANAIELVLTQNESFYLAGHTVSSTLKILNLYTDKDKPNWDIFLYKDNVKILDTNRVPEEEVPEPDRPNQVTIPNIFTPNGDDKNQYFQIADLDLDQNNSLVIYNRWGKQVYHSKSYQNNWEAEGLADGTYFYVLYIEKRKKYIKGWVNVVR